MQIEFLNSVPDSISILENSVVISSKDVCDKINGYRVNEVEKIKQLMLKLYSNYNGFINPYSDNELHQAAELINKFLIKVNNIIYNGG